VYLLVKDAKTWDQAREHAAGMTFKAGGKEWQGHLATVGSAAENSFVYRVAALGEVWLGLSDLEKFGAQEAYGARLKGWKWLTGEELTWENWRAGEPNDANIEGKGEDAVIMGDNGLWNDSPAGIEGQVTWTRAFVVEWETGLAAPPEGIERMAPLLPKMWKVEMEKPAAQGAGPWKGWVAGIDFESGRRTGVRGDSVFDAVDALVEEARGPALVQFDGMQFHWPDAAPRLGWAGGWKTFPHHVHGKQWAGLYATTLHLTKEQEWTFLITADDYAALRIPGVKWQAAHGDGFIDPMDPECLCRVSTSTYSRFLGTAKLPAGDHRLEVVFGNSSARSALSVTAAQGAFSRPGDTVAWRPLGYKAGSEIAMPGISDAGWTVKKTAGEEPGKRNRNYGLKEAAADADTAANPVNPAEINFMDEAAPGRLYFPEAQPLPGDREGQQEYQVVTGEAVLIIPQDGTWTFGFSSDTHGALVIDGAKWKHLTAVEREGVIQESALYSTKSAELLAAEVDLRKGEYKMQFFYVEDIGPMSFSIFGAPAGFPPALLKKGAAGKQSDVDGLPLVAR
jgi:hypothetical protein